MANLSILLALILPLLFFPDGEFCRLVAAGKRRIHITDDLDDVIDDEEDEAWKQWGQVSMPSADDFDPPPSDFSNMNLADIQESMMKRHFGPVFGFVKLRPGVRRSPDMVGEIAMKWSKVLRTGAVEVNFMGVDLSTIMFNMGQGRNAIELKEFILSQPEAYEIKIGDQVFRRPGDPTLEEVIQKLHGKKEKAEDTTDKMNDVDLKEEL